MRGQGGKGEKKEEGNVGVWRVGRGRRRPEGRGGEMEAREGRG